MSVEGAAAPDGPPVPRVPGAPPRFLPPAARVPGSPALNPRAPEPSVPDPRALNPRALDQRAPDPRLVDPRLSGAVAGGPRLGTVGTVGTVGVVEPGLRGQQRSGPQPPEPPPVAPPGTDRVSRTPRKIAGGALPVGRVRLGWVVWAEAAFAAALVILAWRPDNRYLVGAVIFTAIVLAIPIQGRSVLGWLATGIGFLLRRRRGTISAVFQAGPTPARAGPSRATGRGSPLRPTSNRGAPWATGNASPLGRTDRSALTAGPVPGGPRSPAADPAGSIEADGTEPAGALLSDLIPGLTLTSTSSQDGSEVGLIGLGGMWTVILTVRSDQQIVARVGEADTLSIDTLVPLLSAAGIVLNSIQLVVINSPGSAELPETSAALTSHLELLGGLPTAARRRVLVAFRLDPGACPEAIQARGGGVTGAHRAMAATAARAVTVLTESGFEMRTMSFAETANAVAGAAGLQRSTLAPGATWSDNWANTEVGPLLHSSFVVVRWGASPIGNALTPLDQLGNIRARSVATSVSITGSPAEPQISATARVTAGSPADLDVAEQQLLRIAEHLELDLGRANGYQYEAFVAGLPIGGPLQR